MKAAQVFDVAGKVALVTGAAQGLGLAMVRVLRENGALVTGFDAAPGADVQGDVTDRLSVQAAVAGIVARHGRLDICIANAGISDPDRAPLHETTVQGWQRVLEVNLTGVFHTVQAALGPMRAQGQGKIVLVASMWGLIGAAGMQPRPAYAATKGAVVNLARELALEYAGEGIQVNALCPGFFRTPTRPRDAAQEAAMAAYTPLGRIAEPEEIAGAVLFLTSAASDFVTGSALVIDGGVTAG